MKPMGDGIILKSKTVNADRVPALRHEPADSVVITGIDSMEILDQAFEAVRTFQPLTQKQIAALLKRTAAGRCRRPVRAVQNNERLRRARRSIRSGWGKRTFACTAAVDEQPEPIGPVACVFGLSMISAASTFHC